MDHQNHKGAPALITGKKLGLVLGPGLFALILLTPPPADLSPQAWHVAALAVLMAVWWASEALPVAVTALLPLAVLPLMGVAPIRTAAAPYANPLIFLFMGGFLIALAMQRWHLHRRLALRIIHVVGNHPQALVIGFMVASAFLSMWVSNTATTMMMLPIALSVAGVVAPDDSRPARHFSICLMLGIAYAASIGGLGTLVGTAPNALLAAFMVETYDVDIGFARWMMLGVPAVVVMLPCAWFVLTRLAYRFDLAPSPEAGALVDSELLAMGAMGPAERRVAGIFLLVALTWVTRPVLMTLPGLSGLNDSTIAILGGLALFVVPAGGGEKGALMTWEMAERLPWGLLLLFGGGLSLADAMASSGLAAWIGGALGGFSAWPLVGIAGLTVLVVIFLTELTSNTATTAALLPVLGAVATAMHQPPLGLVAPAALAASCAFMLPVATPPNAIVFGSGLVTIPQMMRAGLLLNILGVFVITALASVLVPWVFGG
jgi:sodium-dependent dicarboxylate transporter 2/3/5